MFLAELLSRTIRQPDAEEIQSAVRVEMPARGILRAEVWFDVLMKVEIKKSAKEDRHYQRVLKDDVDRLEVGVV